MVDFEFKTGGARLLELASAGLAEYLLATVAGDVSFSNIATSMACLAHLDLRFIARLMEVLDAVNIIFTVFSMCGAWALCPTTTLRGAC